MTHRLAPSILLIVLAGAGCYGAARPTPRKAELPTLVDGATLDVEVEATRYWSDSRGRYVRSHMITGMSYDNVPLTYHQMRSLADPTWSKKVAEYDQLATRCRHANVPRYIGLAGVVLGGSAYAYGGAVFQENGKLQAAVGLGAMGAGLLSYAAGYLFLGGQACREAASMADKLHFAGADETKIHNDDLIIEVSHLAETFNRRMAAQARSARATPESE